MENIGIIFIFIPLLFSSRYWCKRNQIYSVFIWTVNIVVDKVKNTKGRTVHGIKFHIILLFIFIMYNNYWGIIPYTLPVTRHMSYTISWGLAYWLALVLLGWRALRKSAAHFTPYKSGSLAAFLTIIEFIRSIIRPLTLGFRLAANITAGHVIIGLIRGRILTAPFVAGYIIFEIVICFVQSFVFIILVTIYSNDYVISWK